ncbi:hypothetical protein H0H92_014204, partial [Tricholoma furcatifolium]
MSDFDTFTASQSTAAFSAQYFSSVITFQHALDLDYPQIAPCAALTSFVWEDVIPMDAASTVVIPGEIIPHACDVLEMWRGLHDAFKQLLLASKSNPR